MAGCGTFFEFKRKNLHSTPEQHSIWRNSRCHLWNVNFSCQTFLYHASFLPRWVARGECFYYAQTHVHCSAKCFAVEHRYSRRFHFTMKLLIEQFCAINAKRERFFVTHRAFQLLSVHCLQGWYSSRHIASSCRVGWFLSAMTDEPLFAIHSSVRSVQCTNWCDIFSCIILFENQRLSNPSHDFNKT